MEAISSIFFESLPAIAAPLCTLLVGASCVGSLRAQSGLEKSATGYALARKSTCFLLCPLIALFALSAIVAARARWENSIFGSFAEDLPPTLPPPEEGSYNRVRESLVASNINRQQASDADYGQPPGRNSGGCALVTGASSGIGRSVAIQIARREVVSCLVLVGRNKRLSLDAGGTRGDDLDGLAADLRECYGMQVGIVRADLSVPGEARRVYLATRDAGITVSQLVLAAGWGPTGLHIDLGGGDVTTASTVERVVRINVESTAVLSSLYGSDMADLVKRMRLVGGSSSSDTDAAPHVLIVSSIMGIGVGLPGAALYAATKAFGLSLARGVAQEMEPLGVGVTALAPGATATKFAIHSGMSNAAVWNFPFTVSDVNDVAEAGVRAMLRGDALVVPNFMNRMVVHALAHLVPDRVAMSFYGFCWRPWPFTFPPSWRPHFASRDGKSSESLGDSAANNEFRVNEGAKAFGKEEDVDTWKQKSLTLEGA